MILNEPRTAESIEALLAHLEGQIARLCSRVQIPPQEREDRLQEALLAFVAKREQVVSPRAWLFSAVRNQCRVYWMRRRRGLFEALDETILETMSDPHVAIAERTQLGHDLSKVFRQLPQRCRSIFKLRYAGCEPPEVAERMGYKPSSVRQIANRCIAALSAQLCAVGLAVPRPRTSHD